jgi:hypothetical protein
MEPHKHSRLKLAGVFVAVFALVMLLTSMNFVTFSRFGSTFVIVVNFDFEGKRPTRSPF